MNSESLNTKNKHLILFIGLKLFFFLIFAFLFQQNSDIFELTNLFVSVSDSDFYYSQIEVYLDSGVYDLKRLPGIFPIYAPLYLLLGANTAKTLIILIQFSLSIYSIWMFSKMLSDFFRKEIIITFLVLSAISIPLLDIVFLGLMDSLSISILLLGVYQFHRWTKTEQIRPILLAGLFLTWSFFLREIAIIVYFTLGVFILLNRTLPFLAKIKYAFLFSISLFVVSFIWVSSNYIHKGELTFMRSDGLDEDYLAFRGLAQSFGGRFPKWLEGKWFIDSDKCGEDLKFPFGKRVFTPDYGLDDLKALRAEYCQIHHKNNYQTFLPKVEAIKNSYKKHRWYDYYFVNYFRHLKDYLIVPRVFIMLPVKSSKVAPVHENLLKAYFIMNYNAITIFGFIGLIFIFFRVKEFRLLLLALISPLVFLILMRMVEERYFYPMIPVFTLGASYILVSTWFIAKSKILQVKTEYKK